MKFFYDYFDLNDVCGMYTLGHIFTIFLFAATMVLALYFSKKMSEKHIKKVHLTIAVVLTVCEVLKITLRIIKGQPADTWIPLYYCSLFIFAVWISMTKVKVLSRMGYAYMCLGGVGASLFFTFYPSTSLAIYPLWHPSVWHSFLYHWAMFYLGVLFLWKKRYVPEKRDGLYYFVFIVAACIPAYFINEAVGSNCMFLHDPFKLPLLTELRQSAHWAYITVIVFAQAVALFWACYGLDHVLRKHFAKSEEEETLVIEDEDLQSYAL